MRRIQSAAYAVGGAEGDMFIARLTPDGSALTSGTFLEGPQSDVLEDLVVDANGFVTVCGRVTGSNVQVFITTYEASPAGGLVAKLTAHHDRSQGLHRSRSLPSGACSSGSNKTKPCTFTITASASVTANVQ